MDRQQHDNDSSMPSINQSLSDGATKYSLRAVASYLEGDFEDFYLAAGIAIEQAMKSRLARENVAFIAPDKNFKAALALWNTQNDVSKLPFGTRTIGGVEALDRTRDIEPSFERHANSTRDILRFRNGEAHIGAPGSTEHRRFFASFARINYGPFADTACGLLGRVREPHSDND